MSPLGKLSWDAIPLHEPIIMGVSSMMVSVVALILVWITTKGYWPYLWRAGFW